MRGTENIHGSPPRDVNAGSFLPPSRCVACNFLHAGADVRFLSLCYVVERRLRSTEASQRLSVSRHPVDRQRDDVGKRSCVDFLDGLCARTQARNRFVAVQSLMGIGEPLLDVPTESLDASGTKHGEAGAFEHLFLRRGHVIPPLQAIESRAAEVRQ
jgi:hypothetical protein